jgi:hypothetical protein
MWSKKRFILLYLLSISFLASSQIFSQHRIWFDESQLSSEAATPNTSQLGSNITLNIIKPDLFIIEGRIGINVTSETLGTIFYVLTEESGECYFVRINQTREITEINQTQLIIIRVIPLITTFPGEYHFILNISGLFDYNQSFDMFLGMGYSLFTITLIFIAILSVIAVLNRRHSDKEITSTTSISSQINLSSQSDVVGIISCPHCKKNIDEGLSFCPECGERIPEFLRYNPK